MTVFWIEISSSSHRVRGASETLGSATVSGLFRRPARIANRVSIVLHGAVQGAAKCHVMLGMTSPRSLTRSCHVISVLLERVRKQKFAKTPASRSAPTSLPPNEHPSRHVPAAIRRAVWERDAGRCTYVSDGGRRCDSREFVEFDHIHAWVNTGSHSVGDITLRCRAHNQLRARLDFGEKHMAKFRRTGFKSSWHTETASQ